MFASLSVNISCCRAWLWRQKMTFIYALKMLELQEEQSETHLHKLCTLKNSSSENVTPIM